VHSHRSGLRGAIQEIFRPHSHDAADSVDTALEASSRGMRALKISFGVLFITALLQVLVIVATGSVALLADTIHNFSDALTAVPLFIAFRLSRRSPTRRYTYGYRRAEDLAGVFIVLMIALSAVIAGYEAIDRLVHPRVLDNIAWLFAAGVIGFVGNELVALYRIRVGHQIGSAALVADGYHSRTDGFTSLAVALGAAGVWLGFPQADPIVGLAISIAIFAVLRGAAVQVFHRLMDAVDPAIVDRVETVATQTAGVQRVDKTRVRWAGHRLTAAVSVIVDEDLTVWEADAVAETLRHDLLHTVAHLDSVDVLLYPCNHGRLHRHHATADHSVGMHTR
jgi:cation diffusion facilitator family transporter